MINSLQAEQGDDLCAVMDQALYCLNTTTMMNLEMLQILVNLFEKRVKNQPQLLHEVYQAYLNARDSQKLYQQRLSKIKQSQTSIPPDLFRRFYTRVSQKLLIKLLYYNLHHQSMKFISASLMEILTLNDSQEFEENSFEKFMIVMAKLRLENKALLRMLLDMIVDENMVSSEEEFMTVMEKESESKGVQPINKQLDKLSIAAKKYKESSQMSRFLNIFFTTLRNDTAQQKQQNNPLFKKFTRTRQSFLPHNRIFMTGSRYKPSSSSSSSPAPQQPPSRGHSSFKDRYSANNPIISPVVSLSSPMLDRETVVLKQTWWKNEKREEVEESGSEGGEEEEGESGKGGGEGIRKGQVDREEIKRKYVVKRERGRRVGEIQGKGKNIKKQQPQDNKNRAVLPPSQHSNTSITSTIQNPPTTPTHPPPKPQRKCFSMYSPSMPQAQNNQTNKFSLTRKVSFMNPMGINKDFIVSSSFGRKQNNTTNFNNLVGEIVHHQYLRKVSVGEIGAKGEYEAKLEMMAGRRRAGMRMERKRGRGGGGGAGGLVKGKNGELMKDPQSMSNIFPMRGLLPTKAANLLYDVNVVDANYPKTSMPKHRRTVGGTSISGEAKLSMTQTQQSFFNSQQFRQLQMRRDSCTSPSCTPLPSPPPFIPKPSSSHFPYYQVLDTFQRKILSKISV